MTETIEEVFAWVTVGNDGGEGIVEHEMMVGRRRTMVQFVTTNGERAEALRPLVLKIRAVNGNRPARLIRLSQREVIAEISDPE